MSILCRAARAEGATIISSVAVKLRHAKRRPSLWDDDMIYSPTKYRETEGTKVC